MKAIPIAELIALLATAHKEGNRVRALRKAEGGFNEQNEQCVCGIRLCRIMVGFYHTLSWHLVKE